MDFITISVLLEFRGNLVYQLLNVANGTDISANAVALRAVTSANSTVNSKLRVVHNLPLPGAASDYQDLQQCAVNLALYEIASQRPELDQAAYRERYQDSMEYLGQISSGKMRIDVVDSIQTEFPGKIRRGQISGGTEKTRKLDSIVDLF